VARFAFDAIGDVVRGGRPLFVHAPSGVEAVPTIANAHLASSRRSEPFVVVDGTSTREHDVSRWNDPGSSPIALADRGLLLLVDVGALPGEVQAIIAGAYLEHRTAWSAIDFTLAVTSRIALPDLAGSGRLDPRLAGLFADEGCVSLPRLRDRPEDLRAIVGDKLAREGLRVRGAPVGIEDAAYARLLDHPFDGEDAELRSIVQRLVAACTAEGGDVVRARHVDQLIARPSTRGAADVVERTS
jgi:DNA-binding NtrC family response regulator